MRSPPAKYGLQATRTVRQRRRRVGPPAGIIKNQRPRRTTSNCPASTEAMVDWEKLGQLAASSCFCDAHTAIINVTGAARLNRKSHSACIHCRRPMTFFFEDNE